MTQFTFTTKEAQSGIFLATNDLIDACFDMPPATSEHVVQIFQELMGVELAALPATYADVTTSDDPFEDCHGVCEATAEGMFYIEHAKPHLAKRGCVLIEGTAEYLDTLLKAKVEDTADADTLTAASRRIMEVHLVHIHNIPASELEEVSDLIGHHQGILNEFYGACAERPLPTIN